MDPSPPNIPNPTVTLYYRASQGPAKTGQICVGDASLSATSEQNLSRGGLTLHKDKREDILKNLPQVETFESQSPLMIPLDD